MATLEGKTGPAVISDGVRREVRLGRTGELIVADAHAAYYEATLRGRCYNSSTGAGGVVCSVGLSAVAVTPTLYNPFNSGVNVSLNEVGIGLTLAPAIPAAGVSAVGVLYLVTFPYQASVPTGLTAQVTRNNLIGGPAGAAICYGTATFLVAPTVTYPLASMSIQNSTAASITQSKTSFIIPFNGKFVLPPGTAVAVQNGSGVSVNAAITYLWEEIPILS